MKDRFRSAALILSGGFGFALASLFVASCILGIGDFFRLLAGRGPGMEPLVIDPQFEVVSQLVWYDLEKANDARSLLQLNGFELLQHISARKGTEQASGFWNDEHKLLAYLSQNGQETGLDLYSLCADGSMDLVSLESEDVISFPFIRHHVAEGGYQQAIQKLIEVRRGEDLLTEAPDFIEFARELHRRQISHLYSMTLSREGWIEYFSRENPTATLEEIDRLQFQIHEWFVDSLDAYALAEWLLRSDQISGMYPVFVYQTLRPAERNERLHKVIPKDEMEPFDANQDFDQWMNNVRQAVSARPKIHCQRLLEYPVDVYVLTRAD